MSTQDPIEPVQDFLGRRAFVTGAGGGIGEGIAVRLAAAGAAVACVDVDGEAAARVALAIEAAGGKACAIPCDVSDASAVARAMDASVSHLDGLDVLVNNAGIVKIQSFEEMSLADWDRTFGVNLRSLFLTCQAALPHLRASEAGAIVNIASMAALRYTVPHVDYAATKGGVVSFTRDLAFELGAHGIRVNAVAPGPVATGMMASISDEQIDQAGLRFLLGRMGRPADIAEAVAFLASPRASYITGATLPVTGGAELATRPLRPEDE
ncbi:MAG: SDR family oxidoreductase [bacterium]|nr:SDR family oxidoreductase [bacterium]